MCGVPEVWSSWAREGQWESDSQTGAEAEWAAAWLRRWGNAPGPLLHPLLLLLYSGLISACLVLEESFQHGDPMWLT